MSLQDRPSANTLPREITSAAVDPGLTPFPATDIAMSSLSMAAPKMQLPGDHSSSEDVDAILANELSRLSFQDRNLIQEEIHGVRSMAPMETEQTVKNALFLLEQSIEQLPISDKRAYLSAKLMEDEAFVLTIDMKLCFLRAELFDPSKAAARYAKYLHLLSKHFGPVALQRPLQYSDLTRKEQELCRYGNNQILPTRDRAGRLVIVHHGAMGGKDVDESTRLRILMYLYSVVAEDVDTQRHGAVLVCVGERAHFDRFKGGSQDYQSDLSDLMKNIPVRWSAVHVCLPEGPLFAVLKALLVLVMTRKGNRVRFKFYSGDLNKLEIQYALMSFGIPVQELPVTHSGTLKKKNHAQWIKVRKMVDEDRTKGRNGISTFVEYPRVHDVLFRRGGYHNQFGNLLFQEYMLTELPAYNAVHNHAEKRQIRQKIIGSVAVRGGHFLEYNKDSGVWSEIRDSTSIHNKVISGINDLNRLVAARKDLQESRCDTDKFLGDSKRRKVDPNEAYQER